jgi:hypothetical protein
LERGLILEKSISALQTRYKLKIQQSRSKILPEKPLFGASRDGIRHDLEFEINFLSKESAVKECVSNNSIRPKYLAQKSLQMNDENKTKSMV